MKEFELGTQVQKEISKWPLKVRSEFFVLISRIAAGEILGMPDVRAVPSIGKGIFEIRIKDENGAFRVFYIDVKKIGILVFHAFIKKSQKTPKKEIDTGIKRLQRMIDELKG